MAASPLISIITLHFNQQQATLEFLESSRSLNYSNYEILVCDMNARDDLQTKILQSAFPKTTCHRSESNLGFAGGNNWGLEKAGGEFILFINNDTIMEADLLQQLMLPMLKDERIAAVSPKIVFHDQTDTLQYAGFTRMNLVTGRAFSIGEGEKDQGQYQLSGPTWGVHGAAMMVRRSVIDQVGLFPEKFFLYYEEWDWSLRALKQGHGLWYEAGSTVYHKGSISIGKSDPVKTYYLTRNRICLMRRNAKNWQFILFVTFFLLLSAPTTILSLIWKGRPGELTWFFKGIAWNFAHSAKSAVRHNG